MIEPKIISNSAYREIQNYKENGCYVSLPFKYTGVDETERQNEIRKIMNSYGHLNRSDDEVEDTINDLNESCDTSEYKFVEPFNSIPLDYLIDFTSAKIHIQIVDEYHGRGNSEYYISVEGIIVENEITDSQIEEIAKFLDFVFNG